MKCGPLIETQIDWYHTSMPRRYERCETRACAHIALYGVDGTVSMDALALATGRSKDSLDLKAKNIAYNLDKKGYVINYPKLRGRGKGDEDRWTDWDIVEEAARQSKEALRAEVLRLLGVA